VAPSWRLHQRQVEDGRVDAMGCVRPCYPTFAVFNVLGPKGIVVIYLLLGPIYRILEWMGLLATFQFHFSISSVEVSQEIIFSSNQMREGGR
jgi:hypothetical protein